MKYHIVSHKYVQISWDNQNQKLNVNTQNSAWKHKENLSCLGGNYQAEKEQSQTYNFIVRITESTKGAWSLSPEGIRHQNAVSD